MPRRYESEQDKDFGGAGFVAVATAFAAAIPVRWALATAAGISPQGTDLGFSSVVCATLVMLSALLSLRGFWRCSVALNALTLVVLSMAFASDMLLAFIHLGRHVPYRDTLLASWDAALGFDWQAYAKAFDSCDLAWTASHYAYNFMPLQVPLAIVVLAGRPKRLYTYVAASVLSLTTCCVVVSFFPAWGAFDHVGGYAAGFVHHDFSTADNMRATLDWLRQESPTGIAQNLALISFPSFHTICAVLGAWAFWRVRGLRWVVGGVDLAMLASTPVQGSHYLVDILSGVAVAILSLVACKAMLARTCRAPAALFRPAGVSALA